VVEKIAPPLVALGKSLTYEIIVRNAGAAPAHAVHVEERLPAGARCLGADPTPAVHDAVLAWDLGRMAPGAEAHLRLEVQPAAEGEFATSAAVTCTTECGLRAQVARTGLSLNVTAPPPARVGETVALHMQLINNSSNPLRRPLIRVHLPEGLQHPLGAVVEAELPGLAPGEKKPVTLEVTATRPGRLVGAVSVTAEGAEEFRTQVVVEVTGAAAPAGQAVSMGGAAAPGVTARKPSLAEQPGRADAPPAAAAPALSVVCRDDPLEVGGETIYEVYVFNQGAAPNTDVQLWVAVPEGMALLAAEGPAPRRVQGNQAAFDPLPRLGPRERAVYRVRVQALQAGDWHFKAALRCAGLERPVAYEINTRVYSDQAAGGASGTHRQINNR
jgi:uncharacterized repeat protein (TIGR01451 family)